MTTKRGRAILAAAAAATAIAAALPTGAGAVTYTVVRKLDTPPGQACAGTSGCSLREAVISANLNPGRDRIELGPWGHSIDSTLQITDALTIAGDPSGTLASRLGGSQPIRLMSVVSGAGSLTLTDLYVSDGATPQSDPTGGAIRAVGVDLTVLRSTFYGNRIYREGTLSARGGAIAFNGARTLTIEDSTFHRNGGPGLPGLQQRGGAIFVTGGGTLHVTGSTFRSNNVWGADTHSRGGAIAAENADVTIADSRLTDSQAGGASAYGGAISVDGGSLTLVASTLDANDASASGVAHGGAIGLTGSADATIVNSTLDGNYAHGASSDRPTALGGALYLTGAATIRSSTIVRNRVLGPFESGPATGTAIAGPVAGPAPDVALESSIVAVNYGGSDHSCDQIALDDDGANVVDDPSCALDETTSRVVDDVEVRLLADNGGPQPTAAPAGTSPAVDAVPGPCADPVDQRAVVRPQGPGCDAGAYELIPPPPPDTTIASGPPALSNSPTATFALSGTPGTSRLECRLDDGPARVCGAELIVDQLEEGLHTLWVRAHSSGPPQVDPTPAVYEWIVDLQAPAKPTMTAPANGALLSSGTVEVRGEAEPGARVTVVVDDVPDASAVTADGDGNYVATVALSDGSHQLSVRAADGAGNVSPDAAPRTVTVDTTPPPAPQQTAGPPPRTHARGATIAFSGEAGTSFSCALDGGAWNACTSPVELSGLAVGAHELLIRQRDAAGWDSSVKEVAWQVLADLAAPTFASVPAAVSASAVFAFVRTGGTAFSCRVDGGGWSDCQSPLTLFGLTQGSHVLAVRTRDDDGGVSPAIEHAFTYDSVAPTAPAIGSAPPAETSETTVAVAFSGEAGGSFACALDGGAWSACTSPARFDGLAPGSHRVFVRQTDAAGNVGAVAEVAFRVVQPVEPGGPGAGGPGAGGPGTGGPGTGGPGAGGPTPGGPATGDPPRGSTPGGGGGRPTARGDGSKPPGAVVTAPARTVVRRGTVKLGCALDRGLVRRCAIDLYLGRRRVGSGTASFGRGVRMGAVQVRLTAAGRAAAARSARMVARLRATGADGTRITASRTVRF